VKPGGASVGREPLVEQLAHPRVVGLDLDRVLDQVRDAEACAVPPRRVARIHHRPENYAVDPLAVHSSSVPAGHGLARPSHGPSFEDGPTGPLGWGYMEQEIRYLDFDGRRLAYSTFGDGPPIVVGPRWVSHLEEEWADPDQRPFYAELARTHRVVRFDRLGCGLSDRLLEPRPTIESESRQLEAVIDAVGGSAAVFSSSCSCLAASQLAVRDPGKIEKIVYFGGYASRNDVPDATRASLVQFTRINWGLAAQMFASLFDPRAAGDEIQKYTRMQRKAATAEAASIFLELDLTADLRDVVPHVTVPTLVLHRRGDRTVPIARGRELAALLPNARFVPLGGDAHVPWKDDQRELFRALAGFLHDAAPAEIDDGSPLTSRETEVLRLVATGMSNREIASTLVLSEHTVHRHVANILRKLTQSTRAAAATHATRVGLI
jgi:pimeloyl-ACP methyl ester carboxylesterase/DNA-binding CsgD family transcriptional regulator